MTARLVVLASGRGSNLAAIHDACLSGALDARVVLVVSDRPKAPVLALAGARGLATEVVDARTHPSRTDYDSALGATLAAAAPDLVVLAGFMRILSAPLVERWLGRMVNIHPSLLPAYPGRHTHRRALADAAPVHGASVHFVTVDLDAGPVAMQAAVVVLPGDDEARLAARVLAAEHRLYPVALQRIVGGQVAFRDGAVYSGGMKLSQPERLPIAEVA